MEQYFFGTLHGTTRVLELIGVGAIVLGICGAATRVIIYGARGRARQHLFRQFREDIGRAILLGLEFLVAADIVNTVAIEPTLESLAVLGGIVVIRTFLSFALEVEISGQLPWRRASDANAASDADSVGQRGALGLSESSKGKTT